MVDIFVQMDEGLLHSKLVDRLRALGLDTDQAIGKLYRLWIATLKLGRGGVIGDRSDAWIEEAVIWRGEPGAFARVVRDVHLDEQGRVRDWLDKYGVLEAKRESARQRQQAKRARDRHGDSRVTVTPESQPDVGDEAVTSLTSTSSSVPSPENSEKPELVGTGGGPLPEPGEFGEAQKALAGLVRKSRNPAAVLATLRNLRDGEMGETKRPLNVLARAALDYGASDQTGGFQPSLFRRFCDRAEKDLTRSVGRELNRREERAIVAERQAVDSFEVEAREADALLERFATDNPERYEELRELAEAGVPKTLTFGREVMVRGRLIALVREEKGHAA